jgi:hypothetical protein
MSASIESGALAPPGVSTSIRASACGVVRAPSGKAHKYGSAPARLDHFGRDLAADRALDETVDVLDLDSIARRLLRADFDLQILLAEERWAHDVHRARHLGGQLLDLFRFLLQHSKVIAVDLDRERGAHAGKHLRNAHVDRLGKGQFDVLEGFEFLAQRLLELGEAARPFAARLGENEVVGLIEAHGVETQLIGASARHHARDLGQFHHGAMIGGVHSERGLERDVRLFLDDHHG